MHRFYTQTADQTIANTTTETTMFGTGVGSLTRAANSMPVGRVIRGLFHGSIATTGTPTARIRLKWGSTTLVDTTAVTLGAVSGTVDVSGSFTIICRATGVSGTLIGDMNFVYYSSGGGGGVNTLNSIPGSATIDTTISNAIDLTWQWGTASSSNTITIQTMYIEVL